MADHSYSLTNEETVCNYYNVQVQQQQQQQQQQSKQQQQHQPQPQLAMPATQQQHQQQQQQQQTQQQPLPVATPYGAMANVSMCDYNNNNNIINANNNNNNSNCSTTLCYFGTTGVGSCGGATLGLTNTSVLPQNYGKILNGPGDTTFNNNNNSIYGGTYAMGTPGVDIHTSIMPTGAIACQYAHANGSASCYNRNRYMPYNHNRACAAAAVAAATGHPIMSQQHSTIAAIAAAATTANFNYQQQQQFAPIYQQSNTLSNVAPLQPPPPVAIAAVTSNGCFGNAVSEYSYVVPSICDQTANTSIAVSMPSVTNTATAINSVAGAAVMSCTATAGAGAAVAAANTHVNPITIVNTDSGNGMPTAFNQIVQSASNPQSSLPPVATNTTNANTVSIAYNCGSIQSYATITDPNDVVTLQITNLDYSLDESILRNFLLHQLKPITPVVSLVFECSSYAKVTVPDLYFAKQVVSNLHRKKIGHKRMLVSYTRDSSLTEINTLRCQVAGLLKDVPYYTLPMYKFRELFQSRFKTSISVLDLYKMQDICTINSDNNEDKFISLQPELINSLESSPLMEGLQHSVPYCTVHFKREQHKGWAEQDIEPLPNVCMTIADIEKIIYPLLKHHPGDIPVATLVHCIEGELKIQIAPNENGVNLEHLVCCVQGIQIQVNNFGIKILGWHEPNKDSASNGTACTTNINSSLNISERNGCYGKNTVADPLYQISREVIELVKMSPKSTMKFNRFIPAYHNHFGKQCRVADYGYTKLIELFEALSTVVQIMGDGENRQITLTHRTQIRRFTSDLLRILRAHGNNSVLLSQLPSIFAQTQNRNFDVTDYGVCDIEDILDGLVNSNIVVVSNVQNGKDILISIPKRKQTQSEIEKTCIFAGEMVELFRNALQYTILFQKFVRSYHYHFAYQCRLSDYGFLKLADLMEAIHGVVEMELTNDEDKKLYLSPKVARRVFAEQCEELIRNMTGSSVTSMKLDQVLKMHKKKYGYQIQPQTLGVKDINEAIELLPYVELVKKKECTLIVCHNEDPVFRTQCYRACKMLLGFEPTSPVANQANQAKSKENTTEGNSKKAVAAPLSVEYFITEFNAKNKNHLTEPGLRAMKHAIEIYKDGDWQCVRVNNFTKFLVSIVRLLEQRPNMYLHEIKCALDCNISTTFEFGYPNVYTIIAAYPDLFSLNIGPSQERSDVSLTPNCELRNAVPGSHKHLYGSLKMPYAKQKNLRGVRVPLGEHNSRLSATQAPPHKTRLIAQEYTSANAAVASMPPSLATGSYKSQHNNTANVNTSHYQHNHSYNSMPGQAQVHPMSSKSTQAFANTSISGGNFKQQNSVNSSVYSSGSQHSSSSCNISNLNSSALNMSFCSSSNKENSFNSSMHLFNSSFNSSCELNNSLKSLAASSLHMVPSNANNMMAANTQYIPTGSKLWERRQTNYYQQQQQTMQTSQPTASHMLNGLPGLMLPSAPPAPLAPQPIVNQATAETIGLYELVSSMPICPIYEPPKPDTPPSENMPFWIDPIWTNNNNTNGNTPTKNNLLNIRLPEMKSLNVLPMLLSPYTLSKTENMKQQVFNFDNHDRKIA